ncbi:cyclopropane-fatty-acyl-phospholipid synthase family protein [Sporomusa aerivorans]|uniref:SAM-dependent methyltransferase n=1 Tax=Sporomusa aerivorans TaxID=204936 RepID=UPI00352A399B
MYNAQFWAKAWEEYSSSTRKRRPDPEAWKEFWNSFSGRYAEHNASNKEVHEKIINDLAAQGAFRSGDSLLDIGCGPGTYALPLAAREVKVTAMDTAAQMLAVLKSQAEQAGLAENIRPYHADWHDLPAEPAFDIAFAAKSPAIRDYDSLMKMTKIARKGCCLIGFAGQHDLDLRRLLWEKLLEEPAPGPSFDIIYPLNILYQKGYRPHVSFYSYSQSQDEPLGYLIDHYTRYFAMLGVAGPETAAKIHNFLQERAVNGYCTEQSATTVGVMWWEVKQEKD